MHARPSPQEVCTGAGTSRTQTVSTPWHSVRPCQQGSSKLQGSFAEHSEPVPGAFGAPPTSALSGGFAGVPPSFAGGSIRLPAAPPSPAAGAPASEPPPPSVGATEPAPLSAGTPPLPARASSSRRRRSRCETEWHAVASSTARPTRSRFPKPTHICHMLSSAPRRLNEPLFAAANAAPREIPRLASSTRDADRPEPCCRADRRASAPAQGTNASGWTHTSTPELAKP